MSRTNKGFFSLCISLLTLAIIFNGCEDPGSVGGEFVERPTLTFDTLTVSNTEALSYNGYSGRPDQIPFGSYSDPVFGDVNVLTLLQPARSHNLPDSISIGEDFLLKLQLQLDSLETYGDTLSQSDFTMYEINTQWRGRSLRVDDEIQYGTQVGSFTVDQEKNIIVDLSQQWVDKYKSYYFNDNANADSLYVSELKGIALVSNQNNAKISFTRPGSARFMLINGVSSDTTDTVGIPLRDFGFTVERSGAINSPNTFPLHSTLESLMKISMPDSLLKAESNTKNIIRADLILYEAEQLLDESLPANHHRPSISRLNLFYERPVEPVYEYQFGSANFSGTPSEEDRAVKVNVTNYVNNVLFGNESRNELILGIGSPAGHLRSTLFYDHTASDDLKPKLIITSLSDQQ
ncbi:hypothetical protein [Gracilimonas sp.]|uniref:hypothetical protein n=1 Tax=Gracilimonas sp. TaxID=1974203 RepID=UPI0032EC8534